MRETIEDIVREIRNSQNGNAHIITAKEAYALADRIEAAHKRGREATCEKSSQVGNTAKMREALSDACYAMFNFLKTQNGGYEEMAKALDKAKSTLSAPPRNCDLYKTLDDARNAFFADYVPDETCSSATAFAMWLFDKAKGEQK